MRCMVCESGSRWSSRERRYDPLNDGELSVLTRLFACDRCGAVVPAAERWEVLVRFGLDAGGPPLLHHSNPEG